MAVWSAGKKSALDLQTQESKCPCWHHAHSPMQQDKEGAKVRVSRPELQARWRERRPGSGPEKGPKRHSKMSASQKSRRKEEQSPSAAVKDSQQ